MSFDVGSNFSIESALDAEVERKKANDKLGRTEFLTMLVAQLEHQDPLNPQDASQFSAQLAQFSSLEQLIGMRASIDRLVESQLAVNEGRDSAGEDLLAASLLDKEVSVFDDRLEVPPQGETVSISFYLDGPANEVGFRVLDDRGKLLFEIPAVNSSRDDADSSTVWQQGVNTYEWLRGAGQADIAIGPSEVVFEVAASLGGKSVKGNGVSIGRVVSSSMGFESTVLQLEDGRRVDLSNIFEVRRRTEDL